MAFVMLLGPECFDSLARDEVQYANLGTSTWGQADRTIHYSYDANGSLEKKIIAVTGVADPDTEYIEKFVYSYNLANRLETITHYSYEDLGESIDDDHIKEVTAYVYNDNGIRVVAEYERSVDYYPFDESFELYDQRTTTHLVDSQNHTGYAQTLEEYTDITYLDGSPVTDNSLTTYLIGDDVIAQTVDGTIQYLLYDGHGSTRQLAEFDSTVSIADTYSYDGYGVLLQNETVASQRPGHVSSQATSLLYAGEHFDTDSQNYYLRARWYDSLSGRFNRMDPFLGNTHDPQSLHKYLYCHANPINGIDPSGESMLMGKLLSVKMIVGLAIGALVPAYIAAYQTALTGGTWLQIAKNAGIAWAKWFGLGVGIVLLLPYVAAVATKILVFFGMSKAAATLTATLLLLGTMTYLLGKGMYNIWSSDLPLRVKFGLTGLIVLSLACMLGKGGVKKLLSNAKTIIKDPSQIAKIMKDSQYSATQDQKAMDITKINQYAESMRQGTWDWGSMSRHDPIIVDPRGYIMSGHHRIIAATLAGVKIPKGAIIVTDYLTSRPLYSWEGELMPD